MGQAVKLAIKSHIISKTIDTTYQNSSAFYFIEIAFIEREENWIKINLPTDYFKQ